MDIIQLREYCLSKPQVGESFPFGPGVLVFKVAGKMFALVNVDDVTPFVNLKCDPERAIELREHHSEIRPGYHMNKKHGTPSACRATFPTTFLHELIDHSYALVVESLPKKHDWKYLVNIVVYGNKQQPCTGHPHHGLLFWGFIAAGNSVFIPFCKHKFGLDQFQSQLIDFAFYLAYYVGALSLFIYGAFGGKDLVGK